MVLSPKVGGYFRGIGLVEVICEVCAYIIKNSLRSAIALHVALHVFRQGRGTGTPTMEAKLVQ